MLVRENVNLLDARRVRELQHELLRVHAEALGLPTAYSVHVADEADELIDRVLRIFGGAVEYSEL